MYKEVSKKDFKKDVIENGSLSLVKFKTKWSGACQIIEPIFSELSKSYKDVADFYTVDIEKSIGLDKEYGVMEVPTILFFKGGSVIDHVIGLAPKNTLIAKIENIISRTK